MEKRTFSAFLDRLHCGSETACVTLAGTPSCTDLQTDAANCGQCGAPCAAGASCTAGTCPR